MFNLFCFTAFDQKRICFDCALAIILLSRSKSDMLNLYFDVFDKKKVINFVFEILIVLDLFFDFLHFDFLLDLKLLLFRGFLVEKF